MRQEMEQVAVEQKKNCCWERIEAVVKWTGMSVNSFAINIGLPRGENLYQIKKGNNGISKKLAHRIAERYSEINEMWLLTGDGEMFNRARVAIGQVPLYRVDVERNAHRSEDLAVDEFVAFASLSHSDFAMLYLGGAMGQMVPAGSIVFMKELEPQAIIPSEEYLVMTDTLSLLRTVRTSTDEQSWRLEAVDKDRYDDILVPKSQIKRVWRVEARLIL